MTKYDVTIGIPVYKSESCIRKTLESALSQSYPSIEFLMVDDSGGDGSMDIIREFQATHSRGSDIHVITHQKNLGVSASRNRIIDVAQGEYLYFLDSDDMIAENTISLLMEHARLEDAEIVFGSYEKIELSGKRVVYQYPSGAFHGEDALARFAYRKFAGIQASACNYLVKTSILRTNHHYFIQADFWEDMVFTFDLVTFVSHAVLLSDITYTYLCRAGSLSHYQERQVIARNEILNNVKAVEHLKSTSSILYNKVYYPQRCSCIIMTDFYIACNVLKRLQDIVPSISAHEIKSFMSHPATFRQICSFRDSRLKNLAFYMVGKLPAHICVGVIWCVGKIRKLV